VVAVGEEKEEWPAIGNLGEERKEGSAAAAGRSRKGKEKREEKAWDSVVQ